MSQTIIHYIVYYLKAILKSQGKLSFSNIDEKVSHDGLTRTLNRKYQWQRLYWIFMSSFVNLNDSYLVLDDTILEKPYSKVYKFVRYVFSHKDNQVIKGVQFVMLVLVSGNLRIPLGFGIYDKSKTKIELALDLLSYARNTLHLSRMPVLFDSWYSAKVILKRVKDYGWYFVCRIKRNRKVSGKQVKDIFPSPYGTMRGDLSGLKIILVRHGKYYLVTNRLSLCKREIREWYSKRWQIEEVFRLLKSTFKAKECQSRTKEAWRNHLFLVILGFAFVELRRQTLSQTVYKAKRSLRLKDYRSHITRWKTILKNA